jgi:hypothetical protein
MSAVRVTVNQSVVRVTQSDGTIIRVANASGTSVRVSNIGVQGPPGPRLVEIVYQISGIVPPSRTLTGYLASSDITFIPADAVAIAGTANSVDVSIDIKTLTNTALGSIAFLAGQTTGTVTISGTTLHKNEGLKFVHPASFDTMADLIVTLPANRGS